jgi:heme exporter protein CcmD
MLDMGGYGIYVWPAYALVFVSLMWLMLRSFRQGKKVKGTIRSRNMSS